jgi:hypothetical protein
MSKPYYNFFNFNYTNQTTKIQKPNNQVSRIESAFLTPRGANLYRKVTDCSCVGGETNTSIYKDSYALHAGQAGCFDPVIKSLNNQKNKNVVYEGTIPNKNYNYSYHQYLSDRLSYDTATCNSDLSCNIPSESIVRGVVKYGTTNNPWPNSGFSKNSAVSSGNRLLKLKYDSIRCTPNYSNPNCGCPPSGSQTACRGKYYGPYTNYPNINKKSTINCESKHYLQSVRQNKTSNCN